MRRPSSLAARLMTAQILVIGIGGLTLLIATALIAPPWFSQHLARSGERSPMVLRHAEEAFVSAFAVSLALAVVASVTAAGVVSWFLVRRLAQPVERLAVAADAVAAGDYSVRAHTHGFGNELTRLSEAFDHMAGRLATTEVTRTRLLADLTHELRTPLATLEAYIDGLEDDVIEPDADSFAVMRQQVHRLRRLASDLRETAAAEEHALHLVLTPQDPSSSARAALAAAQPAYAAKGVTLTLDQPEACAPVLADAERLQQVLANLLDNALRHTPPGGVVAVSLRHGATDGTLELSVTDDGEGIDAEQQAQVFQRFFRADPARTVLDGGGSGLGLTIAKAIVEDHHGTITVTSAGPGTGSSFVITLPTC